MTDEARVLIRAFAEAYPGRTDIAPFLYDEDWRVRHHMQAIANRLRARARAMQREMHDAELR